MKTRIIVAALFIPLVFVTLFFLPDIAVAVFMSIVAAAAALELLRAVGPPPAKRFYVYTAVSAAVIPASVLTGLLGRIFYIDLFLLVAVVVADAVFTYGTAREIKLSLAAAAIFGGAVLPLFLSAVVALKQLDGGRYYVLMPFIIAFITDAGAYFTGVFFGKHHPFPKVSPKKTVEGCVGGILIGTASMAVYGVVLYFAAGLEVSFPAVVLYGFIGGIVTELGDLAFSLIKRVFGVKDYGRLLPGHGGVLDRFDSMFFAAPVVHMLVAVLPAF